MEQKLLGTLCNKILIAFVGMGLTACSPAPESHQRVVKTFDRSAEQIDVAEMEKVCEGLEGELLLECQVRFKVANYNPETLEPASPKE